MIPACLGDDFYFQEAQKRWTQNTGWALRMVLGEQALGLLRHSGRSTGISDASLTAKQMHRCQRRGQRDLPALYRWPPQHTGSTCFFYAIFLEDDLSAPNLSSSKFRNLYFCKEDRPTTKQGLREFTAYYLTLNLETPSRHMFRSLLFIGSPSCLSEC